MCLCVWFLVICVYVCCVCVCMYWYVAYTWLNVYVCVSERFLSFLSCIDPLQTRLPTKACTHYSIVFVVLLLCVLSFAFTRTIDTWYARARGVCLLVRMLPRWTHGCLRLGHCPPPDCGVLLWCLGSSAKQLVSAVCSSVCVYASVDGSLARRVGVGVGVGRLLLV